jgi:hypothetical protein
MELVIMCSPHTNQGYWGPEIRSERVPPKERKTVTINATPNRGEPCELSLEEKSTEPLTKDEPGESLPDEPFDEDLEIRRAG